MVSDFPYMIFTKNTMLDNAIDQNLTPLTTLIFHNDRSALTTCPCYLWQLSLSEVLKFDTKNHSNQT